MLTQLGRRITIAVATMLGASVFSFIVLRKLPGDPARVVAGQDAPESTVESLRRSMGLTGTVPEQYRRYLSQLFHGDLGFSYSQGQPVTTLIRVRLPATIELGLTALILAVGMAVVFAGWAVYSRRRAGDVTLRAASSLAMGTPTFWLALVLILILAFRVGVFPGPDGRLSPDVPPPPHHTGLYTVDALLSWRIGTFLNALWHLLLPAFVIAVGPFAFLSRLFRSQLRNTLREQFVTVQRSQGLTRSQVFLRHVVPNAILALLPASALLFAELLTGSVLVEKIFGWPGVGAMTVDAIQQKDFAVVQGVILLSTLFYVVISMLADLVHTAVDPRLRVGR